MVLFEQGAGEVGGAVDASRNLERVQREAVYLGYVPEGEIASLVAGATASSLCARSTSPKSWPCTSLVSWAPPTLPQHEKMMDCPPWPRA